MTAFYLSALACFPLPNPSSRLRENEIFELAAARHQDVLKSFQTQRTRGRWDKAKVNIDPDNRER